MRRLIESTKQNFESASYRTPQYMAWHLLFRREFTKFLNKLGITDIKISKPNHFDASGFFRIPNGSAYYFSIGDLRSFKDSMLIRTAKDFKDFTGGHNQYASLDSEEHFTKSFCSITGIL